MSHDFSDKHAQAIGASDRSCFDIIATKPQKYSYGLLKLGWNLRGREIGNRIASSFGIEERSPFYDARIIEFAIAIPDHVKSRAGGKYVLKKAMKGYMPEEIVQRQDKAEFSGVLAETLLDPEIMKTLANGDLVRNGWLDPIQLARIYELFHTTDSPLHSKIGPHIWPIWMAFSLELSYSQVMQPS